MTEHDFLARQQREANQFAMSLLMPKALLLQEAATLQGGALLLMDHIVVKLAKKFQVSEFVMTIRLEQVGLL